MKDEWSEIKVVARGAVGTYLVDVVVGVVEARARGGPLRLQRVGALQLRVDVGALPRLRLPPLLELVLRVLDLPLPAGYVLCAP